MRVLRRRTERLVDTRLECLGESVLEAVCLGVDGVELEVECLGQVELE
jgi:hypothetical protein